MKNTFSCIMGFLCLVTGIVILIFVGTGQVSPWWELFAGVLMGIGYYEAWRY